MDDELDWYDKDFDEETIIPVKKKKCSKQISSIACGDDYPFDVWYLIGTYISPEDIGRFALICRTTNRVVNTAAFWISIFKKYNKLQAKRFSRILMKEHFSIIRTHTIKSLYKNYSVFQTRLNKSDAIQKDPHFLQSCRCIRIWYSKQPTQRELYNYYFELRLPDAQQEISLRAISPIFDGDHQYMIDKDSWILHIISSNFVSIGPYMGLILSKLTLNMSSDYRSYKLRMWFDSSRLSKSDKSMVIIDPILCLKIYRWYNLPGNLV